MDLVKKILGNNEFINSIFEIGGGNGFFLEAAKDHGFKLIKGVEPSKAVIEKQVPVYNKECVKPGGPDPIAMFGEECISSEGEIITK